MRPWARCAGRWGKCTYVFSSMSQATTLFKLLGYAFTTGGRKHKHWVVFFPTTGSFVSMETNPPTEAVKKYLVNFSMRTSHCRLRRSSL